MAQNPVGWFEIYVQDMPRAKAFYEHVLQRRLERLPTPEDSGGPALEMWAFAMAPEGPGAGGALVRMEGVPSGGNSTLVYFVCEDCAVEAARAGEQGGQVERPKFPIGEYGYIALVKDPDGNLIGLHSMR